MKTKLLVLAVAILALCGTASATYLECSVVLGGDTGKVAQLTALTGNNSANSGGCWEGDFIFSNFQYTPSVGTAGGTLQTAAIANFDITVNSGDPLLDYGNLLIQANWSQHNGGFDWMFDMTLCTVASCGAGAPVNYVIQNAGAEVGGNSETGKPTYTITGVGDGTVSGTLGPHNATTLYFQSEPNLQQIDFHDNYSPAAPPAASTALQNIQNEADDVLLPEPGTMLLMGGALIGLAAALRKRSKSA
jgi:PEP-CTERM motif